jgi:signal transduction histidine kinase
MAGRFLRSIRARLTLSYMLVFGLIQTGVCVILLHQREQQSDYEFNSWLEEQAGAMAAVIEVAADGMLGRFDIGRVRPYARAFGWAKIYYEVRLIDGTLLDHSPSLEEGGFQEHLPPADELRKHGSIVKDLSGPPIDRLIGEGETMRLLVYYHVPRDAPPYIVCLATSLAKLHEVNAELRTNFILVSLFSLLAAGLTTWLLSKRSLRPIQQVQQQVGQISAQGLDQRIETENPDEELAQLEITVNEMLGRLDDAFRAQDEFLTHAAHELKTPLTVLLGDTQRMLRKDRDKDEYEQHLRGMEEELRHMAKVVDSLLMLAKARAGTRALNESAISANDFVTDALERCQTLARHREIRFLPQLTLGPDDGSEPLVCGDPRLLTAMVENLVRNSTRLSPVESTVGVTVEIITETVQISILDRGPGIPPTQLEHIFDSFVSSPVHGRASGGTGIGLAIAQGVAKLHNGSITADNRPGGGAVFTITLPLFVPEVENCPQNEPVNDRLSSS